MARGLPPFAPFPPLSFRRELVQEEWEACLNSWDTLAQAHLRLPLMDFAKAAEDEKTGLVLFLESYFDEATIPSTSAQSSLRKEAFLLSHRALSLASPPPAMLKQAFLVNLCRTFPKSHELQKLLSSLWKRKGSVIENDLQRSKEIMIKELDSGKVEFVEANMRGLAPLLYCSPNAATFFMVGSDLLDSINAVYPKTIPAIQRGLKMFTYLGLVSLTAGERPNLSLLSDHLYSLKSATNGQHSLLSDLASTTPLLEKIRSSSTDDTAGKARKIEQLLTDSSQSNAKPKRPIRRKIDKGKERITEASANGVVHIHRMSLITQIQDLFPDLGSGFITKLLDEYNESVESVIVHLLEDSLPAHLQNLDRSAQIAATPSTDPAPHLMPNSTPPLPSRRNVHDNDDFDKLAIDTSKLHLGRKNANQTADTLLTSAPNKSAILAALAAFDPADDERDDTYDIADVGGTIDTTTSFNDADDDKNEDLLFSTYTSSPTTFGRDAATRRGQARAKLRLESGMTDEAIEGWGLMLARDPRRLRRLEAKYATFRGQQSSLERTAYRASPAGSGDEAAEVSEVFNAARGGRGRGRAGGAGARGGSGRGRGRGNVSGPSGDADTLAAQRRKETNKSSRANHNRRDQRAKKMARGGFGAPPA
jgi:activating signal cointegrator complex subunit 2